MALAELTETPLGLSTHAGGDVDSVADTETGMPKPLSTSYPAIAELPDTGGDRAAGDAWQSQTVHRVAAAGTPPLPLRDPYVPF